jgi:UDPglucose 6-dehydrogenase
MEALDQAHAVVLLTEWDEFKTLTGKQYMKTYFCFDGRNILDVKKLAAIGFQVEE